MLQSIVRLPFVLADLVFNRLDEREVKAAATALVRFHGEGTAENPLAGVTSLAPPTPQTQP